MIDFNQGRFSSVSSLSSAAGGRQTLNELEGRMELGIELGEEVEGEAHLSPAYRSESSTESWIMSRTLLASQVIGLYGGCGYECCDCHKWCDSDDCCDWRVVTVMIAATHVYC